MQLLDRHEPCGRRRKRQGGDKAREAFLVISVNQSESIRGDDLDFEVSLYVGAVPDPSAAGR